MRARSLKPGLFKNELLGRADPLLTILFEGLWCSADRKGRLEDRPLRICAEVFPYRRHVTERKTDTMLQWLNQHGFIARYKVDGRGYIQVLEFLAHQNPHKNEAPSKIPILTITEHGADTNTSTVQAPESDGPITEAVGLTPSSLTPDSGLRTPDSGLLTHVTPDPGMRACPNGKSTEMKLAEDEHHARFETLMAQYPKFAGGANLIFVEKACRDRIDEGSTWDALEAAARRFAEYVAAGGRSGQQFVDSPLKFFDSDLWRRDWTPPPPTKVVRAAAPETSAQREWRILRDEGSREGFRAPRPTETPDEYRAELKRHMRSEQERAMARLSGAMKAMPT